MICDICGKEGARIRYVTRTYGKGEDLLIIEDIPMVSCPHCGESYFTAKTLHEIERIKLHRQSFATKRQVAKAEFAWIPSHSRAVRTFRQKVRRSDR